MDGLHTTSLESGEGGHRAADHLSVDKHMGHHHLGIQGKQGSRGQLAKSIKILLSFIVLLGGVGPQNIQRFQHKFPKHITE